MLDFLNLMPIASLSLSSLTERITVIIFYFWLELKIDYFESLELEMSCLFLGLRALKNINYLFTKIFFIIQYNENCFSGKKR